MSDITITSVEPSSGKLNDSVTITGTNLGSSLDSHVNVYFIDSSLEEHSINSVITSVESDGTKIVFNVPPFVYGRYYIKIASISDESDAFVYNIPFDIDVPEIDEKQTIKYLVTRPKEDIIDDGKGNYNQSPIGFPNVNVGANNGVPSTLITSEFLVPESDKIVDVSFYYVKGIVSTGLQSDIPINKIELRSVNNKNYALVDTTPNKHGFVTGKQITVSGSSVDIYNISATVDVIDSTHFRYILPDITGATEDDGSGIVATYSCYDNDLILFSSVAETVASITSITDAGLYYASVILLGTTRVDFSVGDTIIISGSSVSKYNGKHTITNIISDTEIRFQIIQEYDADTDSIISVIGISSGIYRYINGTGLSLMYNLYDWNGTENDNVAGSYGILSDKDGNALNHYRKGFSFEEVTDYLRENLKTAVEFGRFKGKEALLSDQGALVKWLISGRQVNLGGTGGSKDVYVDGFGLGNSDNENSTERTTGVIDLDDSDAIEEEQLKIKRSKKMALWGLTNHQSKSMEGYNDKSPFVKDYPFIYNSKYDDTKLESQLSGGHVDLSADVERMRMSVTTPTETTLTSNEKNLMRPIAIDTLWYQRDNGYHNNITLDVSDDNMFGKHSISLINNFDTPDYSAIFDQEFNADDIDIDTNSIYVNDTSEWCAGDNDTSESCGGDYVRFICPFGSIFPSAISENVTYKIYQKSEETGRIYIEDMNGNHIEFTDVGTGLFIIQRVSYDLYTNSEVLSVLDKASSITFSDNKKFVKKVTTDNITKYYIKPREKGSINLIVKGLKTSDELSSNELFYDGDSDTGTINIYLNSDEYVTFVDKNIIADSDKTVLDKMKEIFENNNDLIPLPFDSDIDVVFLTEIFCVNSDVPSDNTYNKIRSKKTFIHLPTPIDLEDGATLDVDISLPTVPYTKSFPFATSGSLSGYKNYVTQPRAYVLSGYQSIDCDLIKVNNIVQNELSSTVTLNDAYTEFDGTLTVTAGVAFVSNWKDIEVGSIIVLSNISGITELSADTEYTVSAIDCGIITLTDGTLDSTENGTATVTVQKNVKLRLSGFDDSDYNSIIYNGILLNNTTIKVNELISLNESIDDYIYITKLIGVHGTNGIEGLSERNNSALFGSMPEVEYANSKNLFHQQFTLDNISGSEYVDSSGNTQYDKRVFLSCIYPTVTNTFQWRMDNDPALRMLQWSMFNISACGGNDEIGSFANAAYNRNISILNYFSSLFKSGDNCLFSIYDNPLSYASSLSPAFTQQQINAMVKIRFPDYIGSQLDTGDVDTVGSFNHQAESAYISLIRDFITGRVEVNTVKETDLVDDLYTFIKYENSLPANHNSTTEVPSSFYDSGTTTKFMDFTSVENAYANALNIAYERWISKDIYIPKYIVEAEDNTAYKTLDPFNGVDSTLKTEIISYSIGDEYESDAENRFGFDISGDPVFAFGASDNDMFVEYLSSKGYSTFVIDDVKRKFWESSFMIPRSDDRQIQNMYQIDKTGASIEDTVKFNGSYWIPFAKIFSTDNVIPSENNITDISEYSDSSYAETISSAVASNLIASRFMELGYNDSYVSVNSVNDNASVEEFLRNYVVGYSNKFPMRFYNGYKIMVAGSTESIGYSTDITSPCVYTESDIQRIFNYSVRDYASEFITEPSEIKTYLNDNFSLLSRIEDYLYAQDKNASWMYFENGNPASDPDNSTIKDMITVSGMNYLATQEFYLNKMQFDYTRIKMSFIFSSDIGRWLPLDYRQAPTSYLTPTFGAVALSHKEKSVVYAGSDGSESTDYVSIVVNNVNTIAAGTYPVDSDGRTIEDYLWKNPICTEINDVNLQLSLIGYWEMPAMELNKFCYPFLTEEFPYDENGNLKTEITYDIDATGLDKYRLSRLLEPNKASDEGIDFVVPNNVYGGRTDADNDLFMYQPHMWKVYWHMRPCVCAMDGTDIPNGESRTGGVMADPVLNNIFTYPNPRDPQYYIPWHKNMNIDWLNAGWFISDSVVNNLDTNESRYEYYDFDATIDE